MGWVAAIVAIALVIYSKGFRRLVAGVIAVGAVLTAYSIKSDNNRREAAGRLIPLADVAIDDARLGDLTHLTGRVRNANRSHTLSQFDMTVTVRDCTVSGQCEIVGQANTAVYVRVPPGQARDISNYVFFNPQPHIRGRMEWSYVIDATYGAN